MHSRTLAIYFTRMLYYVHFEWQLKYIYQTINHNTWHHMSSTYEQSPYHNIIMVTKKHGHNHVLAITLPQHCQSVVMMTMTKSGKIVLPATPKPLKQLSLKFAQPNYTHTRLMAFFQDCLGKPGSPLPSVLWCCWLGGRKGIRPVKNWWGCRHGCLSEARCRLAHGPADATATHCLLLQ